MFGPSDSWVRGRRVHHRSSQFHNTLWELESAFKDKFGVPRDWAVLFLTGSGTLANEIVCQSYFTSVVAKSEREFSLRLLQLALRHRGLGANARPCCLAYVPYDTASSSVEAAPSLSPDELLFADMVSAFPYYDPDPAVGIFSTVSCKQLGCTPILSILAVSPDAQERLWKDDSESVLSLQSYLRWRDRGETPHTPSAPLYAELLAEIGGFEIEPFRRKIDKRRQKLEAVVPKTACCGIGPVFTFLPSVALCGIQRKWDLYTGAVGPQVFLYAEYDEAFDQLCDDLRRVEWPC